MRTTNAHLWAVVLLCLLAGYQPRQASADAGAPGDLTEPAVVPKRVYLAFGWRYPYRASDPILPPGVTPAIVEGGGRYLNRMGREDSWWVGGYHGSKEVFDPIKLEWAFKRLEPGTLYVINIEHWPLDVRRDDPRAVRRSVDRIRELSAAIRRINPDIRLGFYAFTPLRDYWSPVEVEVERTKATPVESRIARTEAVRDRWIEGSRAVADLLDGLDYAMPSVYRFYQEQSPAYIRDNVKLAAELGGDRPVVPFFWPQFHNSNREVGNLTMSLNQWREDLKLAFDAGADGVILWGMDTTWRREHAPYLAAAVEEASNATRREVEARSNPPAPQEGQ
jgi:hypothetical protein